MAYQWRSTTGLQTSTVSVPAGGTAKQILLRGVGSHFYTSGAERLYRYALPSTAPPVMVAVEGERLWYTVLSAARIGLLDARSATHIEMFQLPERAAGWGVAIQTGNLWVVDQGRQQLLRMPGTSQREHEPYLPICLRS